jgi:hypothetical protein
VTVLNVYVGQPKPGRFEDVVEMNRSAKKVLERHGAKNARSLVAVVAGAAYGSVVNVCEFDDVEAWGTFYDGVMADEEILALMAQVQGENSPYTTVSMSVVNEIPLGRKRGDNGRILYAPVSAPAPGRFEAAVALGSQAFDLMERHGARNCRAFQQQANGLLPDVLIGTMEFDDMASYGRAVHGLMTDPAAQPLLERLQSSDSPLRGLTNDIYAEIV